MAKNLTTQKIEFLQHAQADISAPEFSVLFYLVMTWYNQESKTCQVPQHFIMDDLGYSRNRVSELIRKLVDAKVMFVQNYTKRVNRYFFNMEYRSDKLTANIKARKSKRLAKDEVPELPWNQRDSGIVTTEISDLIPEISTDDSKFLDTSHEISTDDSKFLVQNTRETSNKYVNESVTESVSKNVTQDVIVDNNRTFDLADEVRRISSTNGW